jgi:hypothetical protein
MAFLFQIHSASTRQTNSAHRHGELQVSRIPRYCLDLFYVFVLKFYVTNGLSLSCHFAHDDKRLFRWKTLCG